ncbi:hypothetical protein GOODEAATRI_012359, partial [Goodea atripinnis]
KLLVGTGFTQETEEQYFQFLAKFEIALPVANNSVESSDLNWKKMKSGGIKIICQSDIRDFSAMAFITDHSDGSLLIEQYVPCSLCVPWEQQQQKPAEDGIRREAEVHYFNMEDCVLAAVEKEHIICPQHPDQPVPLQELVPELFMTDFPSR